ncbi:MAG: long-chain fatty acid--CoA ligase, partial [Acidimicrobiales bacterium]
MGSAGTLRGIIEDRAAALGSLPFLVMPDGQLSYADTDELANRTANALAGLGVAPGDIVMARCGNATPMVATWFGCNKLGAVFMPVNPLLTGEPLRRVMAHAGAKVAVCDRQLLAELAEIRAGLPALRTILVARETGHAPGVRVSKAGLRPDGTYSFDALVEAASSSLPPPLDEDPGAPTKLSYTSGTTGNPKGVVYSHRSIYLHSMGAGLADGMGLSERDTVLPVVPMFHANAWGLPHAGMMMGANIVLPGRFMDPLRVARLIEREHITIASGVPTIWIGLLNLLDKEQFDFSSLRAIYCGGSAVPKALIEGLYRKHINIVHAWGMTETSPLASLSRLRSYQEDLPLEEQFRIKARQGTVLPGVDFRVVNMETGQEVPWDNESFGELQVRGPWVARAYYNDSESAAKFADGWLRTGDVAVVDAEGYIQIMDRTKDLVKSGGEWISSV